MPSSDDIVTNAMKAVKREKFAEAADLYEKAAREASADARRAESLESRASICGILAHAKSHKGEKQFVEARALLVEARLLIRERYGKEAVDQGLKNLELVARQQHALCTSKDVDLPPGDRFDDALAILNGDDPLAVPGIEKLAEATDPETLGIAGGIYKSLWRYDAQRVHLERSLRCYQRGYGGDVKRKEGYPAINVAYAMDVLAALDEEELGPGDSTVKKRREDARKLRENILEELSAPEVEKAPSNWWLAATLAEAAFGIGDFDKALKLLENGRKLHKVDDWELESAARQLASLADVLYGRDEKALACAKEAFSRGFGLSPEAASLLLVGKFGLALSGGGFRASLFHIGVLARMAELDVLRRVEVLSCVSGGSIIGAYYYLKVRNLLQKTSLENISRDDYIKIVEEIADEFLAGVQTDVRNWTFVNVFASLSNLVRGRSRTERIGELMEKEIYSRIEDDKKRSLPELVIKPQFDKTEWSGEFTPKYHNWRLGTKVPILILNATTLNTGHNWQFTATFMGESPLAVDPEVDGNERLRRLYYRDAPTEEFRKFPLARAVAASACVPVLFEPIALKGLYEDRTVRLVDGGVHDNQGIVGLLEQDCTVMLVSDASGQVGAEADPSPMELSVAVRSNDLLMARVRGAEYQGLKNLLRSRVLRGLMFLHLRKDLDVRPVKWMVPGEHNSEAMPVGILTKYKIRQDFQRRIAAIRTDLDCFGEAEAYSLMTSGYCMTEEYFPESVCKPLGLQERRVGWKFLAPLGLLTEDGDQISTEARKLMKVLDLGRHQFFRCFRILGKALRIAAGLMLAISVAAVVLAWFLLPWTVVALLVALILGSLVWPLAPSTTLRKAFRDLALAVFGCPISAAELAFKPWYVRLGRGYRGSNDERGRLNEPVATVSQCLEKIEQ